MPNKKLLVFLSHANEDKPTVHKLFRRLKDDGFDPWMEDRLLPGQDWKLEIEKALRNSNAILLCFSEKTISKEGFVQREFKRAMQYQQEKPEGEIFVIPIRLDQCDVPQFIKDRHWVDFPAQYKKLVLSLKEREKSLAIKNKSHQTKAIQTLSKRRTIPSDILSKATEKINEKKNQMQPGYNFGEPTELRKIITQDGKIAITQFYKNGMICCKVNGYSIEEARAAYGDIYNRYMQLGNEPWKILGLPISNEGDAAPSRYVNNKGEPNRGRYSEFEMGELVWYSSGEYRGQVYVVKEPFRKTYDAIGGSGSFLGFPISDTYSKKSIEICDFEGGTIVSLNNNDVSIVRKLLIINYIDSPLSHLWQQYSGPELEDSVGVRINNQISFGNNMVVLSQSINSGVGIFFPNSAIDGLSEKFCGITIKSLIPGEPIRVYIRAKTNSPRTSILEYNSNDKERGEGFTGEEGVDYWKIPMPKKCNDSNWHTMVIDLKKSVLDAFSSKRKYELLERFYFRGRIGIAELLVSDSREAIEAVAINPIIVE